MSSSTVLDESFGLRIEVKSLFDGVDGEYEFARCELIVCRCRIRRSLRVPDLDLRHTPVPWFLLRGDLN